MANQSDLNTISSAVDAAYISALSGTKASNIFLVPPPAPDANSITATIALTSYISRCGNNVTDIKNLYNFIKGSLDLGMWNNFVYWPMRYGQNATKGNTVYSLGGLGTYNGTLASNSYYTGATPPTLTLSGVNFYNPYINGNYQYITLPSNIANQVNSFAYGCGALTTSSNLNRFFDIENGGQFHIRNPYLSLAAAGTNSEFTLPSPSSSLVDNSVTSNVSINLNKYYILYGSKQGTNISITLSSTTTTTPLATSLTLGIGYNFFTIGNLWNGPIAFTGLGTIDVPLSTAQAFDALYKSTLGQGLNAI